MEQGRLYIEHRLLDDIYTAVNRNFMSAYETRLGSFLRDKTEISQYFDIFMEMQYIVESKDYITNLGMYNSDKDHYVSILNGIVIEPNKDTYKLTDMSLEELDELSRLKGQEGHFMLDGNGYLNYIRPLPLYGNSRGDFIFFSFNTQAKSFKHQIIELLSKSKSSLYILDAEHNILMGYKDQDGKVKKELSYLSELEWERKNYSIVKDNNERQLVTWSISPKTGWIILLEEPYVHVKSQLWEFTILLIGITLLFLLIAYFGSKILTNRIYRPLNNLLMDACPVEAKDMVTDEIGYLRRTLKTMKDEVQEGIMANRILFQYKILMRFFYESAPLKVLIDGHKNVGIQLEGKLASLIVIEFLPHEFRKMSMDEKEIRLQMTKQMVLSNFDNRHEVMYLNHPLRTQFFLINHDEHQELGKALRDVKVKMDENYMHYRCLYMPNMPFNKLIEARDVWNHMLQYVFVMEEGDILPYHNYLDMEKKSYKVEEGINQFVDMLEQLEFEEASKVILSITNSMMGKGYALDSYKTFIQSIDKRIHAFCRQHFLESYKKHVLGEKLQKAYHFTDAIQELLLIMEAIQVEFNQKNSEVDFAYVKKITDYIDTHVNQELSLVSVSKHFNQSQSHLSRLFKQRMGINISNYIIEQKLNRAAWCLIHEPDRDINDIAASLGYYTPSYFARIFKQKFSLTPLKYRKENKSSK